MNTLKVVDDEKGYTHVYINDTEIENVFEIKYKQNTKKVPQATVRIGVSKFEASLDKRYIRKEPFFEKIARRIKAIFV